jgi:hypothetical protein
VGAVVRGDLLEAGVDGLGTLRLRVVCAQFNSLHFTFNSYQRFTL